jgi:hypothetical protein
MDRRTGTWGALGTVGMVSVGLSVGEGLPVEEVLSGRAVSVVLMPLLYAVIRRECKPACPMW